MGHFVQYHKHEKMGGPFVPSGTDYAVQTDKPWIQSGDVVWLLTGEGKPRQYFLCQRFVVNKVVSQVPGKFKYRVSGRKGKIFEPPIAITENPWFQELLRLTGRFGFGLQPIKSQLVVAALEGLLRS